jgi:anti-anti-sigma factor
MTVGVEVHRLLAFARDLQRATTFAELMEITQAEIAASVGYQHAWMFVADDPQARALRLIDIAGSKNAEAWEVAPRLTVKGDAMLEEIVRGDHPVVVEDARVDPRTNKQIVEAMQNRTIINMPMWLTDRPFGALGTGTFGDEGVRPPTGTQLEHLVGMSAQVAVAASRIRLIDERRHTERALFDRERTIARQAVAIHELSIPVLQVRRGVLIVPLVGTFDEDRSQLLVSILLERARSKRANFVIIDLTGVSTMDVQTAEALVRAARACRLMGAKVAVSGVSTEVAETMAATGANLSGILVRPDLERSLEEAERALALESA